MGWLPVEGTSKFRFMSDTKWLLRQGFQTIEKLPYGFSLLALKINPVAPNPLFNDCVLTDECPDRDGTGTKCAYTSHYLYFFIMGSLLRSI